jgi:hypothetical protein
MISKRRLRIFMDSQLAQRQRAQSRFLFLREKFQAEQSA